MTSPAYSLPNSGGVGANRLSADRAGPASPEAPAGLRHSGTIDFCEAIAPELERTGWTQANAHFDAACAAAIARDDAAYERHMAAFRALSADWTAKA
jgi:hypothetical protein